MGSGSPLLLTCGNPRPPRPPPRPPPPRKSCDNKRWVPVDTSAAPHSATTHCGSDEVEKWLFGEKGVGWGGEVARGVSFRGARCLCPHRSGCKPLQPIFTGGGGGRGGHFPASCDDIQLRCMIFFLLNTICYANAACDSLIKSICYREAQRGRWDFRIMGRVRGACGFVIRHRVSSGRPRPCPHPPPPPLRPAPRAAPQ